MGYGLVASLSLKHAWLARKTNRTIIKETTLIPVAEKIN
jgi:hypothetical protein